MSGKEITVDTYDSCTLYPNEEYAEPDDPIKSTELENVKNVRVTEKTKVPSTIRSPFEYTYPTIEVEFMNNATEVYKESYANDFMTNKPDIEVYLIEKCAESDEKHRVTKYKAWSVWEETTTNRHGDNNDK
jgi:hypothetical protein